jgi:hypothetical protein
MSNTSTVTPYDASSTAEVSNGLAAACVAGAVGAVSLLQWLTEETPGEKAAQERLKELRRKELVTRGHKPADMAARAGTRRITSVGLHLRKTEPLIRTAERLGYKVEGLGPQSETLSGRAHVLLRRASGERLAVERSARGRLIVHASGDAAPVRELVRQHSVDRVMEHLSKKCAAVRTASLANGEVQIMSAEAEEGLPGGRAEIRAQVNQDGSLWVDIEKIRGGHCAEIVAGIAEAVGGEVTSSSKKDSYFQLPGEPAKTNVKI